MTFSPINKQFVYLIKKNDLTNNKVSIKIGFSKEPQRRLKELQTCNDSTLSIVATFHVGYTTADAWTAENQVLKMFKKFQTQTKNEWVQFDPDYLIKVALPQINEYVKGLNIGNDPLPVSSIGNSKMAKKMYMALKVREYSLLNTIHPTNHHSRKLTLSEEFELAVIRNALEKEKAFEMKIRKAQHERKVEKAKRLAERKAKETRAFHYLAYCLK